MVAAEWRRTDLGSVVSRITWELCDSNIYNDVCFFFEENKEHSQRNKNKTKPCTVYNKQRFTFDSHQLQGSKRFPEQFLTLLICPSIYVSLSSGRSDSVRPFHCVTFGVFPKQCC